MKINEQVEAQVRAVLDAAVHRDSDRFDSALDALSVSQETLTKAVELTLAVNAAVLFEVHDGLPSTHEINEISRNIGQQERWAEVSAQDVHAVLSAVTTGKLPRLANTASGVSVVFVVAANLLATASQPDEGEWWFNYLDKVEAAIEAAG
ncbi:phosphoenolpyruvate-protein kinase (PTS system EI component) [Micromonospora vinacea]|uniref:Phosphoenolpyruvate-protein kinase (PTS system EI component) n=1 Tax=Micromonospora vinacea TaxID=709878 RepID=A0ABS0KCG8_9ACTN|nr:hypothetical protein [Micromonospora vinacea]MBG6106338.1 phosphoenolpyruvate-protein kinase (PTS system EI component) [Micromonospora vinacea]